MRITKRVVDSAPPGDKDRFLWDAELKGFGLKINPKGRKVYVVQYRVAGRQRRFTIGHHGSPWTPEQARQEATRLLGLVVQGQDPAEEKKQSKQGLTIAELCDLYSDEGCAHKKPSTRYVDRGRIERHIKPQLGTIRVDRFSRRDAERFMLAVADGKTATDVKTGFRGRARVTGGKGTANRAVGLLGAIFSFAVARGLRADNPVHGIKKYKEGRRDRFLSPKEMAALGEALTLAESKGVNPVALAAIRLLLLTGCRKSEILSLQWKHVDFDHACLHLPGSKTGFKVVPLGAPALALLASLPRIENNPYVLPGEKPGRHIIGVPKVWEKIRATIGLEDVSLHTFRHVYATIGVGSGMSLPLIGGILGHASESMTARYGHLSNEPLKATADRISSSIAASLEDRNTRASASPASDRNT
ncbi:MAG: tyrosine-type recombinase/integrase [Magnetococcales bacterium]|nr:tyrosine-type recombinase/integrase [Magnetococcales bacterium]